MGTIYEALQNQVIDTTKDTHLKELKNEYTSFRGVTWRDLIKHRISQYGRIKALDLESKNQQMNDLINLYLTINK